MINNFPDELEYLNNEREQGNTVNRCINACYIYLLIMYQSTVVQPYRTYESARRAMEQWFTENELEEHGCKLDGDCVYDGDRLLCKLEKKLIEQ